MRTQRSKTRQPSKAKVSRERLHARKKTKHRAHAVSVPATRIIARHIEALLLSPTQSINQAKLALMLHTDDKTVHSALRQLQITHARRNSPFMLVDDASGWQFAMIAHPPGHQNSTQRRPAADDEIFAPAQIPSVTHHVRPTQTPHLDVGEEQRGEYGEFLQELNEKIAAIAHHNKNTTTDEHLRERLLTEIEGLMHAAPEATETR